MKGKMLPVVVRELLPSGAVRERRLKPGESVTGRVWRSYPTQIIGRVDVEDVVVCETGCGPSSTPQKSDDPFDEVVLIWRQDHRGRFYELESAPAGLRKRRLYWEDEPEDPPDDAECAGV